MPDTAPLGDRFDALADANRRAILSMLAEGGMAVVDISSKLPISRPAVSRHLRLLSEAGLVTEQKLGTRRIYQLQAEGVEMVRTWLEQVWGEVGTRFRMVAENTQPPDNASSTDNATVEPT